MQVKSYVTKMGNKLYVKENTKTVVKYKQASIEIFQNYRKEMISMKNHKLLYLLRINY